MTSKPPLRDDEATPVPITKKSTGSYAVAEQNRHWCLELAAHARQRIRVLPAAPGRRDIAEKKALEEIESRAKALAQIFERWAGPILVGGEVLSGRLDTETERMPDLAAYGALVSDAAKVGVKPF